MPTKKEKPAPGPDDLVRQSAGSYQSGDGRFEIQKADAGWYLVDRQQANEFGQQLIHGPLPTLDAVREALPGMREVKPMLRIRPAKATRSKAPAKPAQPPPPPPSWIDELTTKEASEVRRLIAALEREGLGDAEQLVRRHREDSSPTIVARVIEGRVRRLLDEHLAGGADDADVARLVASVVEVLAEQGSAAAPPLPRWALVEVGRDQDLPARRVRPRL